MPDLSELRKELRELRKAQVKPVSRMRKGDISQEIDKLRGNLSEIPNIAQLPSRVPPRKQETDVQTIKEAREHEFPVRPAKEGKSAPKAPKAPKTPKAPSDGEKKKSDHSKLIEAMKAILLEQHEE
jgi:hypothetical protein